MLGDFGFSYQSYQLNFSSSMQVIYMLRFTVSYSVYTLQSFRCFSTGMGTMFLVRSVTYPMQSPILDVLSLSILRFKKLR